MLKLVPSAIACASIAALGVIFTGSPAMAGSDNSIILRDSGSRELAYAAFQSSGDKISAQDLASDTHSAVTVYVIEGESTAYLWDHDGTSSKAVIKTINRAEGKSIKFKTCTGEYSTKKILSCSKYVYGVF